MPRFIIFKKAVFLSLIACVVGVQTLRSEMQVLDGLAAVVNGDPITFSQVRELVGARENALSQTYHGKELDQKKIEVRTAAVNELIDRQLILQEFKKNKYNIPEYVVEDRLKTIIRESFGGNRQAFLRTLDAQGYTLNRFKEVEQEKIIVQAMRQKAVKSDLIVPPRKIEEYYTSNRGEYTTQERVKLRMIVLKREGATDATQKAMAEEIRQKVAGGADFGNMAQLYSQDSAQAAHGDWGWIDRKTLNEKLTKVAFGLKPGEMSKVIEDAGNYYILFVEAKKNASTKSVGEVRDDIVKKLTQEEQQKQQEKWIASLRAKAAIQKF